jgi:hypothetical protein
MGVCTENKHKKMPFVLYFRETACIWKPFSLPDYAATASQICNFFYYMKTISGRPLQETHPHFIAFSFEIYHSPCCSKNLYSIILKKLGFSADI